MSCKIVWRDDRSGAATHATGATFLVSRTGWITVRDDAGRSDEELKVLIAGLHEQLANMAQKGDAIH